jgi:hypothetical protein
VLILLNAVVPIPNEGLSSNLMQAKCRQMTLINFSRIVHCTKHTVHVFAPFPYLQLVFRKEKTLYSWTYF